MHIVHFDENMLIWDAADLDAFMEMYGVEAISLNSFLKFPCEGES